ncbi:MAG: hypothetical protein KAW41_03375 [Candidatus Diapherotrites archaeon]|nr:hypothetical protein [Candidatus Diapherotrites archaeon]
MGFVDLFGDTTMSRVLDFLTTYEGFDYSLTEMARNAEVSYRSLQRIFPQLVEWQFVKKTRRIGRAEMYTVNTDNEIVKELDRLATEIDFLMVEKKALAATS